MTTSRLGTLLLTALLPAGVLSADSVDDYVRNTMEQQKIPGLALAIVQDGELLRAQGYGLANVEHDVAVTADTIFQSGSVGKQFTAAGILLLAEEGKLRLDDPLALHFPGAPASWHRIRVRHLLSHTSGLKDYGDDEIDLRRDYTEEELLGIAMRIPLEFEPGAQWSYSNTGYLVLGLLTSKLAGKHWSEFLRERVFLPTGMQTTAVISEADIVEHRAAGYQRGEEKQLRNQEWVAPTMNRLADGALYFTVKDLAAWDRTLTRRKLLAPESYEAWWTPVALSDGTNYPYGFGWGLDEQRGHRLIEHGGSWQGFRAAIARYVDDGLTVVVLANVSDARPETLAHEIAGILVAPLRLPDPAQTREDPDSARPVRLRQVLEAWAAFRVVPAMGRGLAATASGSAREAASRRATAERLENLSGFTWLEDDDLSSRPLDRRGETVTRIAHYALEAGERRSTYRFYLTADGRVADFSAEVR